MIRFLTMFALASAVFSDAAADPYAGYIYPAGIQAGTTNRFIVGGQKMWRLRGVHFGCRGLKVLDIKSVPRFSPPAGMQRKHLVNWLDGIAKGVKTEPEKPNDPHITEWRSNRWWQALGSLGPLEISIVERYLFTPRNPLQDTPSISQMAIVTVAADATVRPGVYDASLWNDGGISAPRPFVVTEAAHVQEPLYAPPHREWPDQAVADATISDVVLDGQIMPGEIDAFSVRLSGGKRYRVKVKARELLPYIGDAVPGFFNPVVTVKDGSGRVVAAADDSERFRPDPCFDFRPVESGEYRLEIHDVLFRGRADFVYSITVESHVTPRRSDRKTLGKKSAADGVLRFSGTVGKPGAVCEQVFTIGKEGTRVLEVSARRKGSPLDPVLTLRRVPGGDELARWDDVTNKVLVGTVPQAECDPVGTYDFKEPGRYVAEIADRTGHGGKGYSWDLEIRPPKPEFEVYSTRSTLPLYRGRPLKVDFVIVRKEGFAGTVTLEFPKDVKARGHVATAGVDRVSAVITYVGRKPVELCSVKVAARAKIGGRMVRRNVVPCDEYEQAFAWKHLVPAKSFVMRATPGRFPPKKGGCPVRTPRR